MKILPIKKFLTLVALFITFLGVGVAVFAWILFMQIPSAKQLRSCFTTSMYKVYLCPGGRDYIPLKNISPVMRKVLLVTEDSRFYQHHGFDWEAIEKSFKENLKKGKYVRGGSTITQQLAKNLFLSKEKSLFRKGYEAIITWKIENVLSKNEIMERYLNVVEFGPSIFGIKKASYFYFQKNPSDLSISECAFLAMLLPNPKIYSRSFFKKELTPFALARIRRILGDLREYSMIGSTDYDIAINELGQMFRDKTPPILSTDLPDEETAAEEEE